MGMIPEEEFDSLKVAGDTEQREVENKTAKHSVKSYFNKHAAVIILAALLASCLIVAAIVIPLAALNKGVLSRKENRPSIQGAGDGKPQRKVLVVEMKKPDDSVMSRIPPSLHPFIDNIFLDVSKIHILRFPDVKVLAEVYSILSKDKRVSTVMTDQPAKTPGRKSTTFSHGTALLEGDGVRKLQQTIVKPNDPDYNRQTYLSSNTAKYFPYANNVEQAWSIVKGNKKVVVAVVDTGFDMTHPDLKPNAWVNPKEIPGNKIDDDKNGFVDDINGWNFGCDNNDLTDEDGHGCNVAGVIGSATDNNLYYAGIAQVSLMTLNVMCKGELWVTDIIRAYEYAAKNGAHIVQASLGPSFEDGGPTTPANKISEKYYFNKFETLKIALATRGAISVAAAGNEYINLNILAQNGWTYWPCMSNLPNNLCVGATYDNGVKADFSNFGKDWVDISTIGHWVCNAAPMREEQDSSLRPICMTGTSQATPQVSGVAALMYSLIGPAVNWNFTAEHASRIKIMLLQTVKKLSPNVAAQVANKADGSLDAFLAVKAAQQYAKSITTGGPTPIAQPSPSPDLDLRPLPANISMVLSPLTAPLVLTPGLLEMYSMNVTTTSTPAGEIKLQDVTLLDSSMFILPSDKFKYKDAGNWGVTYTGYVPLSEAGVYSVRVTCANSRFQLSINGRVANVTRLANAAQRAMSFNATKPGWYSVSLKLISLATSTYLTNSVRTSIAWMRPRKTSWESTDFYFAPSSATRNTNTPTPIVQSLGGVIITYNASGTIVNSTTPGQALLTRSQEGHARPLHDAYFLSMLTVKGLLYNASDSGTKPLFPGISSNTRVLGSAKTFFNPPVSNSTYAFMVECRNCRLYISDLMVLHVAPGDSNKTSACIRVNTVASASSPIPIYLNFETTNNITLSAKWMQCTANDEVPDVSKGFHWRDLNDTTTVMPYTFSPTAAGSIPGMQCDITQSARGAPAAPPTWRLRLPMCNNATAYPGITIPQRIEAPSSTCAPTMRFRLKLDKDLLPGLSTVYPASNTNTRFNVTCWTFITPAYKAGFPLALRVSNPGSAYFGGAKVPAVTANRTYPIANITTSSQWAGSTPNPILLSFEWLNVASDADLTVLGPNDVVFNMSLAGDMILPILPTLATGFPAGTTPPPKSKKGFTAVSYTPSSADVPGLIQVDMSPFIAGKLTDFVDGTKGLDLGTYTVSGATARTARYSMIRGYFKANVSGQYTLTYTGASQDLAYQANTINFGGVTLVSPRPYVPSFRFQTASTVTYSVNLRLQPGYYLVQWVSKVNGTVRNTVGLRQVLPGTTAPVPISSSTWFSATD